MTPALRRASWGGLVYLGAALAVAALGIWFWAGRPGLARAGHERALRDRAARNLSEAAAAGRIANHHQFTRVWLPRAALINSALALGLAAAWPLVRRRLGGQAPAASTPGHTRLRRAGWCGVAAITVVAGWANAPRLDHSLWGDEENTLRRSVVGEFDARADGPPVFAPATWDDTFFHYRDPNNHVLFSIAARISHTLLSKPPQRALDTYFSEWAFRLPAFLAGGLAVLAVAGLGAAMGWRRAGWIAAVLLVLHPWFVRYSTEARGYAFLLAGFPALMTCFLFAVRTGRWRWWLAAGVVEWAMVYTWPLSLHGVVAANLSALLLIWCRPPWSRADRLTLTVRWAVAGVLAVMALLQLFLPHVFQLSAYLARPRAAAPAGHGPVADAITALFTGKVWQDADLNNPLLTPWVRVWDERPLLVGLSVAGLAVVLAAGLWRAWRSRDSRCLLVALAAPAVLMVGHSLLSSKLLLPWYLVPCLPGVLLLLAGGLDDLASRLRRPSLTAVAAAAGCLLFALLATDQRRFLRTRPIEPNREAALLVQPVLNPYHPDYQRTVLTGGFLMQISAYDPGVREFKDAATLRAYLDEADRSGRDFALTYGLDGLARQNFPEIMRLLDDPRLFEHVATLPGMEPFCTRHVYRHRVGSGGDPPALNGGSDSEAPR